MMSNWIKLDPARLNTPHELTIGDVTVQAKLSPHDVPMEMRGGIIPATGEIVVEWSYIDDEPSMEFATQTGCTVHLGKHSGRILGVKIPRTEVNSPLSMRFVTDAVHDLDIIAIQNPRHRVTPNESSIKAAEQAVQAHKELLFG